MTNAEQSIADVQLISTLRTALAAKEEECTSYANQVTHWIGKHDALKAELAECQEELSERHNELHKSFKRELHLGLRVKALREAVRYGELYAPKGSIAFDVIKQALADSDKTADEVIASFLGEPVGGFIYNDYHGWQQVSKEHENDDGVTKLYAPKVKK